MTDRNRASVLALVVASLAGFVSVNAAVLGYDAAVGHGPLAGVDRPIAIAIGLLIFPLAVLVYAVATWWLNLRGALIGLVGFAFIGTLLFLVLSPWNPEPPERLVCCDGVRTLNKMTTAFVGILAFFVVPPITVVVRRIWRHIRPAD